jgi:hypothetical protein
MSLTGTDGGHFELEGDLLTDEDAAGFERSVPIDAPILAVHGGRAVQPDAGVAVRVDGGAAVLEPNRDGLGDVLDL